MYLDFDMEKRRWLNSLNLVWTKVHIYVWLCLLCWLIAAWLLVDLAPGADLIWFNSWKGSWVDYLFIYGTKLGEEHPYILATIICYFWRRGDALWIPLTGVVVTLASFAGKQIFREPRPGAYAAEPWFADQIILVDGIRPLTGLTSFPSGHTMSAFALICFLIYLFPLKKIWVYPLLLLAILVGLSRLYLVMHFLRDVITGSMIGVGIGFTLAVIHAYYSDSSSGTVSANN